MNISLALGPSTVFVLIVLVAFLIFFLVAWSNVEQGRGRTLRALTPLNRLRSLLGQSAESGRGLHFSPGSGGLNDQPGTAETLNGLALLDEIARGAARAGASLEVSANDTLTYLAAGDVAEAEFEAAGRPDDFDREDNVRFVTQQDRLAYIVGVESALGTGETGGAVLVGRFDAEYLLAGETASRLNIPQVVGSSRVEALPLMTVSAGFEETLVGEEIYAAPAYLSRRPALLASLRAQDALRLLVIAVIILGVIAASTGLVSDIGNYFLR